MKILFVLSFVALFAGGCTKREPVILKHLASDTVVSDGIRKCRLHGRETEFSSRRISALQSAALPAPPEYVKEVLDQHQAEFPNALGWRWDMSHEPADGIETPIEYCKICEAKYLIYAREAFLK